MYEQLLSVVILTLKSEHHYKNLKLKMTEKHCFQPHLKVFSNK